MKFYSVFVTLFFVLFLTGCSKYVSVSGKVTYPDGIPVTIGQVAFDNGEFVGRAYVNSDGIYQMGRIKDGDGIPSGTYKVYMYDANIYENSPNGGSSIVKPQVSSKYTSGETTDLTCEVKGKTVFNFKVERP
jgi:hypothetical protein